tara:strand:- start:489 stop:830 length:342 start_codon:yes stop_codon:yes gene_type:complete
LLGYAAAAAAALGVEPQRDAAYRRPCLGAQEVLPLYFKHDNLRSFIRQLNIYGFQRCPNASGRDRTMEFFHPMFTRNGARNLKEIKRGSALGPKSWARPARLPPSAVSARPTV